MKMVKQYLEEKKDFQPYFEKILQKSLPYLNSAFSKNDVEQFLKDCESLKSEESEKIVVEKFSQKYIAFTKKIFQDSYKADEKLCQFLCDERKLKIIWGDCLCALKKMKSESIHLMVTSPPYYNAREYSHWSDLNSYLEDMRLVIREAFRVLENHRVFVWNVGDIFDNDRLTTKSVWGKRRIPLGAYFIKIFEEEGFTFVDDFIWDKGEVQSERQKNGGKPFAFYQYPMNCYEHILIFHKHRDDNFRYPCPVCGTLQVNGNAYSEIGLKSWECKNEECFKRSAANRGKRFSLKTISTQGRIGRQFEINEELIKKWRRDIVKISPVIKINSKGQNTLGHTAPFPSEIPEMAVNFFSYPGEIVLDPFGGSMTTAICAYNFSRVGVGIELNREMFEKAIKKNLEKNLGEIFFNLNFCEIDIR